MGAGAWPRSPDGGFFVGALLLGRHGTQCGNLIRAKGTPFRNWFRNPFRNLITARERPAWRPANYGLAAEMPPSTINSVAVM